MDEHISIAILDSGGGHRSVASAVLDELVRQKSSSLRCEVVDFYPDLNINGLKHLSKAYEYIITNCVSAYDFFYKLTDHMFVVTPVALIIFRLIKDIICKYIRETRPQIFVVANPSLIGHLLSYAREECGLDFQIITLITDPITVHTAWINPKSDLFIVTSQVAFDKVSEFIPIEHIKLVGFPVHSKFYKNRYSKTQARKILNIHKEPFTILITGGGIGSGLSINLVKKLIKKFPDYQFLCITGTNEKKYQILRKLSNKNVLIYGFTQQMNIFMAACDVVISKAGPSTMYECIALNRFLIVTSAIGRQELGNLEIVRKYYKGWHCSTASQIIKIIIDIQLFSKVHQEQPKDTSVFRRTDGAKQISEIIVSQLQKASN